MRRIGGANGRGERLRGHPVVGADHGRSGLGEQFRGPVPAHDSDDGAPVTRRRLHRIGLRANRIERKAGDPDVGDVAVRYRCLDRGPRLVGVDVHREPFARRRTVSDDHHGVAEFAEFGSQRRDALARSPGEQIHHLEVHVARAITRLVDGMTGLPSPGEDSAVPTTPLRDTGEHPDHRVEHGEKTPTARVDDARRRQFGELLGRSFQTIGHVVGDRAGLVGGGLTGVTRRGLRGDGQQRQDGALPGVADRALCCQRSKPQP